MTDKPTLARLLTVRPAGEPDSFVGDPEIYGPEGLYGGHLLGQCLSAAFQTVEPGKVAQSFHGYFVRRGDPEKPLEYRVEHLREVTALDDVSLDIAAGEFLTLMGPSGSGKSTLLHIIAGIDRPTKGQCRVQDVDVTQLNESELADWRNQNVGFVFQTFNLIPVLTAFENVELPLLLTRLGAGERKRRVAAALEGQEEHMTELMLQASVKRNCERSVMV